MESLMMMVWRMRQDVAMNQTRAMIQAIIAAASEGDDANKNMQDAWADYKEELFPFQRGQKKRTDQAAIDYLKQEVARGPLKVIPLQPVGKAKSMLRHRHAEVEEMKLRKPRRRRRR
jgi:hypothetical protein